MGVFTFVCKQSGSDWSAKQLNGDLESSGDSTIFDLQRKLVQVALSADSSGPVQSSFTYVTPSSAVFQGVVGGNVGGGSFVAAPAVASGSGGGGDAPAAAEKKEEVVEEESDDEPMGGLFDDDEF